MGQISLLPQSFVLRTPNLSDAPQGALAELPPGIQPPRVGYRLGLRKKRPPGQPRVLGREEERRQPNRLQSA
jgi:hypothetical protein